MNEEMNKDINNPEKQEKESSVTGWTCPGCDEKKSAEETCCEACGISRSDAESGEIIEEVVEGYWICPNCEAKNRGAKQGCSQCGAIRGENVKFFCDDDAPVITDEEELEAALSGPDWICEFCGNTSPASAKNCTGCGSSRESGKQRKVKDVPLDNSEQESQKKKTPEKSEPAKPLPLGCQIGCGVFALLFLILMWMGCQEKPGQLEVTQTQWKRVVTLEQYKTVVESAWQSELPSTARQISSKREIRRYNKIPDGTETVQKTYTEKVKVGTKKVKVGKKDLGNGRFKNIYKQVPQYKEVTKTRMETQTKYRKEPVYENKVTYETEKWKEAGKVEASGTTEDPKWPETGVVTRTPPQVNDKREKGRKEEYLVKARQVGSKEEFEIKKYKGNPLTFETFMKLRKGTKWKCIFDGLGNLKTIQFEPDKSKK